MSPSWMTFLLYGLGLFLVGLEILFPSFGALAFLAACAIVASIYTAFSVSASLAWGLTGVTMVLIPLLVYFGIKWLPKTPLGKLYIPPNPAPGERHARFETLLGKTGMTITSLRPAGMAEIEGKRLDITSDGDHLEPGTPVKVSAVEGIRIVVRRHTP